MKPLELKNPSNEEGSQIAERRTPRAVFFKHAKGSLVPLDIDKLLTRVIRRTGLTDFGEPAHSDALRNLVRACNDEANLSLFGRLAARHHLLDLLETRLRLAKYWRETPKIQEERIHSPIFITGLPRSGSTFLHDLLSQDRDNRVPRTWEVMFPLPLSTDSGFGSDGRIKRAENQLRWLRWIQPSIVKAHPVGATFPQECIAILSYAFHSDEFLCMFWIPSYETWLRAQDMSAVYEFHRRFLKHLQWHCPGKRWVLKAPDHINALPALFEIYPDAFVVFLHRDPLKVLGSSASLATMLRSAFSRTVDPFQTGADEARILGENIRKIMEFRDRHPSLATRLIDVQYLDVLRDPMAVVRRIYHRSGPSLSLNAESQMLDFLKGIRSDKAPRHVYRLADFGLDSAGENPQFSAYCRRFAIEREPL